MTRAAALRNLLLAAVLLLLASALRLHRIDAQSLWFDEGWSAWAAIQPTLAQALLADATNPPLYYLLLNFSTGLLGDSEFSLRLPSLLASLLLIVLTWQLALRCCDRRAAWLAGWLAACSAPLWWAAQEARMYALLALLTLALLLAWQRLLRRPDWRSWLLLLSCETLILYTHNTGPVFALWLNLAMLLHWLVRRSLRRPDWRAWLAGQALVALLWAPWLLNYVLKVAAANSALRDGPQPGIALFSHMWGALLLAPWELTVRSSLTGIVGLLALALLLLAPWRQTAIRWLMLHLLLLAGLLTLGLGLIGNGMHGRYLVPLVPLLCVLLGAAAARLPRLSLRLLPAAFAAALLLTNLQLAADPALQHDDARGMALYYADALAAGDSVLAWSYAERYDLSYYWRQLKLPAQLITLPENAGLQRIAPLLPRQGKVALNQWYTQRADYRGMASCLLAQGAARPPGSYTVYGMSTLLFDAPPTSLPEFQSLEMTVQVDSAERATLLARGALQAQRAEQALCLPVSLLAGPHLASEIQAAILLRNRLGQIVSKRSAIFATDDQRSGLQARPGDILSAWPLIWLPFGAPPGDYEVWLRVFDEMHAPDGYELRNASGAPAGRELLLGQWRLLPGADWRTTGRETDLSQRSELAVGDDLRLLAHNLAGETLHPGQRLDVSMLWQGRAALPWLSLAASDGSWARDLMPQPGERDEITLDWREVTVPSAARAGEARMLLPDGTALARWRIEEFPRVDDAPDFAVAVGQSLGELGVLTGFTLADDAPDRDAPLDVALVWQAGPAGTELSYTVFVQLLDAQGRLIAQSDALPAAGARPTSGWRSGEYIVDEHRLRFNATAQEGVVRLIVGMYDARSGERLAGWPGGADHLMLPGELLLR